MPRSTSAPTPAETCPGNPSRAHLWLLTTWGTERCWYCGATRARSSRLQRRAICGCFGSAGATEPQSPSPRAAGRDPAPTHLPPQHAGPRTVRAPHNELCPCRAHRGLGRGTIGVRRRNGHLT